MDYPLLVPLTFDLQMLVEGGEPGLMNAGFGVPEFDVHATQSLPGVGKVGSAYIRARKP